MNFDLPRRARLDLISKGELSIKEAIDIIEGMGAHHLLTDAQLKTVR